MEFFIFLILGFVLWLLIWSLVSVFKVSSLREDLSQLQSEVLQVKKELEDLRASSRERTPVVPPAPTPVVQAPAVQPPTPPPVPSQPPTLQPVAPAFEPASYPSAFPAPSTVSAPPPLRQQESPPPPPVLVPPQVGQSSPEAEEAPTPSWINWELFMGVRLFAWLGGLAAFFGVALFVKLSFENNWLPPEVRVACGFLAGVGLLFGGLWLSRKAYAVTSQTLCATGVVVLYAVTFACRAVYHFEFFGVFPTFALMVLITATAFLLAVRLGAQVVALLGLLGGFLTPVLLSTGQDNPTGLFTYIALLDAGLIAVALYRRWHYMIALAAGATFLMQVGWTERFFTVQKMPVALAVLLGFNGLFLGAAWLARRRGELGQWISGASAGLALSALGFAFHFLGYRELGQDPLGLFVLVLGADLVLLALSLCASSNARLHFLAGSLVFAWLGSWTLRWLGEPQLYWALGASLGLALLHTGFPLYMARRRPGDFSSGWSQIFAPLALVLVMLPLLSLPDLPFLVWPVIFLLDLVAIAAAFLGGGLLAVLAVLILSLLAVAAAIFRVPAALSGGSGFVFVLLAGLFALLFVGFGLWALRRLSASSERRSPLPGVDAVLLPYLPVLSALLPFVLLIMVVLRLGLATPHAVFGLALALSLLLIGLARLLEEGGLILVSLLSVAALEWAWLAGSASSGNAPDTLFWFLLFYPVFLLPAFLLRSVLGAGLAPWVAAAAAGPLQALLIHRLVQVYWPNGYMGLIPLAFALPSLACLAAALRLLPQGAERRLDVLALFGAVALLFITAVIPVQFERQWITVGWALEAVAVLWLFHRVPHPGLRIAGFGLLCLVFIRLALNPAVLAYHPRGDLPLLNWYLYAYGTAIVCLLVSARLLAPPRDRVLGLRAPAWFAAFAGVLAFLLINLEIADFFGQPGSRLHFNFAGNDAARDMSYTIAWGLYALLLLVLGLWKGQRFVRRAALGLLSVTLLKLFLHDLSSFGQIYRVLAFIVVAAIALLASFLYQRYLPASSQGKGKA